MNKKLIALAAVIMALIIGVSAAGCDLVTVNSEKDMEQVVATVNIGNEGGKTESIYKKEMIMAYLNYGYYYVVYQEYTQAQTFEMIIDQLVNTRVLVQYSMQVFENDEDFIKDESKAKWDVERYLSSDSGEGEDFELGEINEALYNTYKSIDDLVKSYMEAEGDKLSDTVPGTVRTVPTGAANAEDEVTDAEKKEYVDNFAKNGFDTGAVGSDRRKAYNEVLAMLEQNALIGENFDSDISETQYFKDTLKGNEESLLLTKFENHLKKEQRESITYEDLEEKYAAMYEAQKKQYQLSEEEFKTALSSATASSPLVYTPVGGYGYVYNLLLGASDEQTSDIEAIESKDAAERAAERRTILQATRIQDLRSTWIQSGYDFDGEKFTGDYTFAKDAANSLPFKGQVTLLNPVADGEEKPEDYKAEYRVDSVHTYGLDEFITLMENYLYGETVGISVNDPTDPAVYRKAVVSTRPDEYDAKINELIFAFSTDDGSLNTYKGYVISPNPILDGTEEYMEEFAKAGRELLTLGGSSYIMAATDYGYHVMFYSQALGADTNYETLNEYLDSLDVENTFSSWEEYYNDMIANWDDYEEEDFYLYTLAELCANVDTNLTNKENSILKIYKNDESKVKIFESVYADLLVS